MQSKQAASPDPCIQAGHARKDVTVAADAASEVQQSNTHFIQSCSSAQPGPRCTYYMMKSTSDVHDAARDCSCLMRHGADSVACIQLWSLHGQCHQMRGWGVVYLLYLLACALQYRYLNNITRIDQSGLCSLRRACRHPLIALVLPAAAAAASSAACVCG
jgi:hypothetical protein